MKGIDIGRERKVRGQDREKDERNREIQSEKDIKM